MANNCNGILRIVSKDKNVFKRLEKIATYKDSEFFLSRCFDWFPTEKPIKEGVYYRQDISVEGAWNCSRFFTDAEDVNCRYKNGAHLSNLQALGKRLRFGAELFAAEAGMGFCEHYGCNHKGVMFAEECADYTEEYPETKEGETDYDAAPDYYFGDMDDYYGQFETNRRIYG